MNSLIYWSRHLFCVLVILYTVSQCKSAQDKPFKPRVIVIGGGIAGIAAARALHDQGDHNVTVLEARGFIGGRIRSIEPAPAAERASKIFEPTWLLNGADSRHPITKLAQRWNLGTVNFDLNAGLDESADFLDNEEDLPKEKKIKERTDFQEACVTAHKKMQEDASDVDKPILDALKLSDSKWQQRLKEAYQKYVMVPNLEELYNANASQISTRFLNGVGDYKESKTYRYFGADTVLNASFVAILDRLSNESLQSGTNDRIEIKLNTEVTTVEYPEIANLSKEFSYDDYEINVTTTDGTVYHADHIIIAVPLGVLKAGAIEFIPPLSTTQQAAIERIGYGNLVRAIIIFDKPFWPLQTKLFLTQSTPTGFIYKFANLFAIDREPALMATISGEGTGVADALSDEQLQKQVLATLSKMFGEDVVESASVVAFRRSRLGRDPRFHGSGSYPALGMLKEDVYNIRQTIAPFVFFAGEHTMFPEELRNTIQGAYLSGIAAAADVMNHSGAAALSHSALSLCFLALALTLRCLALIV